MRALLLVPLLTGACTSTPVMTHPPDDFAVEYFWNTGSLPPPYHYETTIRIDADGAGAMETALRYGSGPSRAIPFTLDRDARDALFAALSEAGLFTTDWREPEPGRIPVGGSLWSLNATADGRTVRIPSYGQPRDRAAPIRTLVLDAVPASVAADLDAWRAAEQEE